MPDAACGGRADEAEESSSRRVLLDVLMYEPEQVGGSFELIDHAGVRRTDTDVHGNQEGGQS